MSALTCSRTAPPDARDRLLEAAGALFASHGYQAIGLRDLAGHLGLRAGSLYHHIESKQALLFELIESSLTGLLCETRRGLKGARSPNERLKRFVRAFINYSQSHPNQLTLLTREAINLSEEQNRHIDLLKNTYVGLLIEIVVAECQLSGPASASRARSIAQAVLSMLYGQAHWGNIAAALEQIMAFVQGIVRTGKDVHA